MKSGLLCIILLFILSACVLGQHDDSVFSSKHHTTPLQAEDIDKSLVTLGNGIIFYTNEPTRILLIITCKSLLVTDTLIMNLEVYGSFADTIRKSGYGGFKFTNETWMLNQGLMQGKVHLKKGHNFFAHEKLDIALIKINIGQNVPFKGKIFKALKFVPLTSESLSKKSEILVADKIHLFGYPYEVGTRNGLTLPVDNDMLITVAKYPDSTFNPVYRSGIVSWKGSSRFIIDAMTFAQDKGALVRIGQKIAGMVTNPICLTNGRQVLESNTHLSECVYMVEIEQFIEKCIKKFKE